MQLHKYPSARRTQVSAEQQAYIIAKHHILMKQSERDKVDFSTRKPMAKLWTRVKNNLKLTAFKPQHALPEAHYKMYLAADSLGEDKFRYRTRALKIIKKEGGNLAYVRKCEVHATAVHRAAHADYVTDTEEAGESDEGESENKEEEAVEYNGGESEGEDKDQKEEEGEDGAKPSSTKA